MQMNYLRQASKQLPLIFELIKKQSSEHDEYVSHANWSLQKCKDAVKFILPEGGQIFDTKLRGLPEIIKLPYPKIMIEYEIKRSGGIAEQIFGKETTGISRKRIVLAEEVWDKIIVTSIIAFQKNNLDSWVVQPYNAAISSKESHDYVHLRSILNIDGPVVENVVVQYKDMGGRAFDLFGDDWERHAAADMADELSAVLVLVEALTCKNIKIEALPVPKNKSAQKRGSLPFDEYHVLSVDVREKLSSNEGSGGSHRSPREHLRRGHIRRLPTGNIWVNSTVVNAGAPGKIIKHYALEAA